MRARMRAVVNLGQLRRGELRVTLCRSQPLVAHQLLDGPQISAFLQQVGSEGVAKGVGMHLGGEPAAHGDLFDQY